MCSFKNGLRPDEKPWVDVDVKRCDQVIHIAYSEEQAWRWLVQILNRCNAAVENESNPRSRVMLVIGLDGEFVKKIKGQPDPDPIALVQIATDEGVFLFPLAILCRGDNTNRTPHNGKTKAIQVWSRPLPALHLVEHDLSQS